jgi:hypothetical protein
VRPLACVVILATAASLATAGPVDVGPPKADTTKTDSLAPGATFSADDVRLAAYALDLGRHAAPYAEPVRVETPATDATRPEQSRGAVSAETLFLSDLLLPSGASQAVLRHPARTPTGAASVAPIARFSSDVALDPAPGRREGAAPWIEPAGWGLVLVGLAGSGLVLARRIRWGSR